MLYFSLLLSVVQLLATAYRETFSAAVHAGFVCSYMPGHHCSSKLWVDTPQLSEHYVVHHSVMLTASQLVPVTASAQAPCQVSAKHSQCCSGDSCSKRDAVPFQKYSCLQKLLTIIAILILKNIFCILTTASMRF